jgi:hypothetical protein
MYIPNIELFYSAEGIETPKDIREILEADVPRQEILELENEDISKPVIIEHDIRLLCSYGSYEGILSVYGKGKHGTAARVLLPEKIKRQIHRYGRKRQKIWFPVELVDPPLLYWLSGDEIYIREFFLKSMGEVLNGVIYREYWRICDNDEQAGTIERMEIGCGISLEKFKKLPRLRLD